MKKALLLFLATSFLLIHPQTFAQVSESQLVNVYKYAYLLYLNKKYDPAKDIFKKIALTATRPDLNSNSLYYYSLCAFQTKDFDGCVKGMTILAKKWPNSAAIKNGHVTRFCNFIINQVAVLQTHWDYFRYKGVNDEGVEVWRESIPPGFKIKRINFKLGFGLYRVLALINPNSADLAAAKKKLDAMQSTQIFMVWVDEKPAETHYGHPADFFSKFSIKEKKIFSRFICERMFYNWTCEKFFQFCDTYDDVRNLKPRFVARSKTPIDESQTAIASKTVASTAVAPKALPPPPLNGTYEDNDKLLAEITSQFTLERLFAIAGYDPYKDSFTNLVDSSTSDLNL